MRAFLVQLPLDQPVAFLDHLPDKVRVIVVGVEVPVAPQDEGLVDGVLQAGVALLGDAVLVALAPVDAGGLQTVVVQQGGVGVIEPSASAMGHLVGGGKSVVAADLLGDAAQGQRDFWSRCLKVSPVPTSVKRHPE